MFVTVFLISTAIVVNTNMMSVFLAQGTLAFIDLHGKIFSYSCVNGGTCVDGVDMFTCSCPAHLTGDRCECLIINEDELDCSYVAPSTEPEPPTTTAIPRAPSTQVPTTDIDYTTTTQTAIPITPIDVSTTTANLLIDSSTYSESTTGVDEFQETSTSSIEFSESTTQTLQTSEWTSSPFPVDVNTTISPDVFSTLFSFTESKTESELVFSTKSTITTTLDPGNCRKVPCMNGGICLNTPTGLRVGF